MVEGVVVTELPENMRGDRLNTACKQSGHPLHVIDSFENKSEMWSHECETRTIQTGGSILVSKMAGYAGTVTLGSSKDGGKA